MSPFTRTGRAMRGQVFHELMSACVTANGLRFPVVAVHCLPKGALAATRYQEPSHEGDIIADFPGTVNATFPVRTIYIDLNTFRCVQSLLTKELWERALRQSIQAYGSAR